MKRTLAFIQARMSSTRLPGKVLAPLGGEPLILYMVRRVARARNLDGIVLVTSTDHSDDILVETVAAESIPVFRGDLADVLKRFADAARQYEADEIVRLTGDCPLTDPAVVDAVITARRSTDADYASNVDPPQYPDGLDVECFTREALERAHSAATTPAEREHVTLWMRSEAAGLRRLNLPCVADLSHLRFTVDYADDLELVRHLVAHESTLRPLDLFDMLRLLWTHPELRTMNPHPSNEGLAKSLGR